MKMAHVSLTTSKRNIVIMGFGLGPQVVFNLTRDGYVKHFRPSKPQKGKLVASDLHNPLLQDIVAAIDTVEGLPVVYHPFLAEPSRSRDKRQQVQWYSDNPQTQSVCGAALTLTHHHHNKLCLLHGLL